MRKGHQHACAIGWRARVLHVRSYWCKTQYLVLLAAGRDGVARSLHELCEGRGV
jgi:hypothetical protein